MNKNIRLIIIILFSIIIILAFITLAVVITRGIYPWLATNQASIKPCTQEAKLCPDGSSVGRTGPNCEFAKCPGEEKACKNLCGDGVCQEIVCLAIGCPCAETKESCPQDCGNLDTTDWQTYRNEEYGFEIKYPNHLELKSELKQDGTDKFSIFFGLKERKDISDGAIYVLILPKNTTSFFSYDKELAEAISKIDIGQQIVYSGKICKRLSNRQVDGHAGIHFKCEGVPTSHDIVYFMENEHVFVVGLFPAEESGFDQILSTFKFIK